MSTDVQHLEAQNRFVYLKDGDEVGLIDYRMRGNEIHLTHSEIDPHLRGEGVGSDMVQDVLERIRIDTEFKLIAECPFVVEWLDHHPEYQELETRG